MVRGEYPGAVYYAMSHGARREHILVGDVDRQDFLKTEGEACLKPTARFMRIA